MAVVENIFDVRHHNAVAEALPIPRAEHSSTRKVKRKAMVAVDNIFDVRHHNNIRQTIGK